TRTLLIGFSGLVSVMALYALLADNPIRLFVIIFLIGATSSALIPTVQSRIITIAGKAELLGAALNHASFTAGNSLGAALGGLVIASGFGYMAPGWVAVGLASTGCVLALISVRLDKVRPRVETAEHQRKLPTHA